MKSFIGWIGGKSQLKKYIIPLIPTNCNLYIEVCGGAGWVLFGKPKIKGQMEVFNDIDGDLMRLIGYKQEICLINIAMKSNNRQSFPICREPQRIFAMW